MKKKSGGYYFKQIICWVLLLQLINISLDPPDLKFNHHGVDLYAEDLSINEIESIYELISEYFFDSNIPETEDYDINKVSKTIDLYFLVPSLDIRSLIDIPKEYNIHLQPDLSLLIPEPNSPPPKTA